MRVVVTALVIALACAAGAWLAYVDSRPNFDDVGIEAGLTFVIAAVLSAVRPGAAIIIAFIVGGPIPIVEAMRTSAFPAGIVAIGFAVAGALIGAYVGLTLRRTTQPSA